MKNYLLFPVFIAAFLIINNAYSQTNNFIEIDLCNTNAPSKDIDLDAKGFVIVNRMRSVTYKVFWKKRRDRPDVFVLPAPTGGVAATDEELLENCDDVAEIILAINNAENECEVKTQVQRGNLLLTTLPDGDCKIALNASLEKTKEIITFPFAGDLNYNETLTLRVERNRSDNNQVLDPLVYTFTTEKQSRWLTHFGLTYAPSLISDEIRFFSKADPNAVSTFQITEQNNRNPKPLENISATLNFTYPFSSEVRGFDLGYTAGFGLNPGLQLSGHTGLSAVIGTNIILGTGIVIMQKYNLNGEYAPGDIIKENLSFEALHRRVWRPELYITLGFRFDTNPFGGSSDNEASPSGSGRGQGEENEAAEDTESNE